MPAPDSSTTLTVTQLNRQAKRLLEGHFEFVWIEGELSNLAQPGSGHWYFTLKDNSAQVRCAMFRNRNQRVRFNPKHGQQLLVRARVSLYEGRGDFQLIVEHMEDAGAGALQRAYEVLRDKLRSEGLFEADQKLSLPSYPSRVALITSPTGAVIRDLLSVFRRRFPALDLSVLPVPVQGDDAAPAICRALNIADGQGFDAIVVARGGGSLEDLWAFNDEELARTIAACATPVVSAIGHETDFTIADFVADQRAPTPSAAAEMLSPDRGDLLIQYGALQTALGRALRRHLHMNEERLRALRRQLRHPGDQLSERGQRLDDLTGRLRRGMDRELALHRQQLNYESVRLNGCSPRQQLAAEKFRLAGLLDKLSNAVHHIRQQRHERFAGLTARLNALSPLATLERGYAIVNDDSGTLVTDAAQVEVGDILSTRLATGSLRSQVLPDINET